MVDNLKFWSVYLLVIAGVLFAGWRQPLRYRFMSQTEIYALEHPVVATPPPPKPSTPPTPWMWDPNRRTNLDKGGYNEKGYTGGGTSVRPVR